MANFVKFNAFVEALAEKKHNLGSDQLKIALSNVAPDASTDAVLADITEISYTNLSSRNLTTLSSGQTAGLYKLVLDVLTLIASGGPVADFRYIILYNDTAAADDLIGYYDNVDTVSMIDTDEFDINFSPSNGVLQLQ